AACSPEADVAARMLRPGAAKVGASRSKSLGPRELKSATIVDHSSVIVSTVALSSVAVAPGLATTNSRSVVPSPLETMTEGIPVLSSAPMTTGGPGNWFTTITPTAPASAALSTLTEKLQSPRSISASVPVKAPAGKSSQPRPLSASTTEASRSSLEMGVVTPGPVPGTPARPVTSSGTGVGPVTETSWAISRGLLVAATAAFQGAVLATVWAAGPSLPADAAT